MKHKNTPPGGINKLLPLLAVWLCMCQLGNAQNATVTGTVTDTINKQHMQHAAVALLRAKDSVLIKFTRANANGAFALKQVKPDSYILLVAYPQYADYADRIAIKDSTPVINVGDIKIILKANLLRDIIVRQQIGSIRLKGDTTEFMADSFRLPPNATVEDLLKKMPGIQVDKNGKITAQGETVQKVLLDGEEFFGDDPTLITQNLRADMVASVQVYDKKSAQAAFTGIDDGVKQKTINIKLKDSKKNGWFGKADAGGGPNGYFNEQAMLNMFKNKEKFAVYGIASNIGKAGLTSQDMDNYGDPNANTTVDANGNVAIGPGGDDITNWNGQYSGQGYPLVQTGGVHFNNKWDADNESVNGNYRIMNLMVNGTSTTNTQNILSNDTINYTNNYQKFSNSMLRNRASGTYEVQFDSTSSLLVAANGGSDHKVPRCSIPVQAKQTAIW